MIMPLSVNTYVALYTDLCTDVMEDFTLCYLVLRLGNQWIRVYFTNRRVHCAEIVAFAIVFLQNSKDETRTKSRKFIRSRDFYTTPNLSLRTTDFRVDHPQCIKRRVLNETLTCPSNFNYRTHQHPTANDEN